LNWQFSNKGQRNIFNANSRFWQRFLRWKSISMQKCGIQDLQRYTLLITEKPDAAERIASAISSSGKAKKTVDNGVPYYVVTRSETIIVVPALGHLYTLASKRKGRFTYPVFDIEWVPKYLAERGAAKTRIWLNVISKLCNNADMFVDACDYDIEGSIIGYCILKYACGGKEKTAKRMKYSTLTKEELEKAYTQALPTLDFALIEAGLTRHEVDWLYGVNLSRALTEAAKSHSGHYSMLSTGRVQGPTLKFIEAREKKIKCFVPTPYWSVKAKISIADSVLEVENKEKIETKAEADAIIARCKTNEGTIEKIRVQELQQKPPHPFDLGSLQSEAYRVFKYTPKCTLKIAQRLYLDALISYPRTGSQQLPPTIGYENILKKLSGNREYTNLTAELLSKSTLRPMRGNAEDPAHPAVYPTGDIPERILNSSEKNVLDLVVRRFLAVFGEPAVQQTIKVIITIGASQFELNGRRTLEDGWFHFYKPYLNPEDKPLPPIKEGQKLYVEKVVLENKFTKPLSRYNPGSLLRKMEGEKIGTKATRAGTIQILYDRKYIQDEKIMVTDIGFKVIEVLRKYCPSVVSLDLTRKLEERMNEIQQGNETKENTLNDTIAILETAIRELKQNENAVGASLSQAIRKSKLEERTIGACPVCHSGKLLILHSRKTGKRFVGCTNYFENACKASFPLPQSGIVRPMGKNCKGCGWPIVRVRIRRKQTWNLCFNSDCSLRKELGTKH
jgi:DNA topoisomerase I